MSWLTLRLMKSSVWDVKVAKLPAATPELAALGR